MANPRSKVLLFGTFWYLLPRLSFYLQLIEYTDVNLRYGSGGFVSCWLQIAKSSRVKLFSLGRVDGGREGERKEGWKEGRIEGKKRRRDKREEGKKERREGGREKRKRKETGRELMERREDSRKEYSLAW